MLLLNGLEFPHHLPVINIILNYSKAVTVIVIRLEESYLKDVPLDLVDYQDYGLNR